MVTESCKACYRLSSCSFIGLAWKAPIKGFARWGKVDLPYEYEAFSNFSLHPSRGSEKLACSTYTLRRANAQLTHIPIQDSPTYKSRLFSISLFRLCFSRKGWLSFFMRVKNKSSTNSEWSPHADLCFHYSRTHSVYVHESHGVVRACTKK